MAVVARLGNTGHSSGLSARQRGQVYNHSSIFDSGGPTTASYYTPKNQVQIYSQLPTNSKFAFKPELRVPKAADLKQTQNFGHDVVFPAKTGPHETDEKYNPRQVFRSRETDAMQVVKSHHEQTTAIPKEQWACPGAFLDTERSGWKDARNEITREHSSRDHASARDHKYYELSSALFDRNRHDVANPPGKALQPSDAHFLCEDSSMKAACVPHSAGERFHGNLMASTDSGLATKLHPASQGRLEEPPENPRRRNEKNFSDIFGASQRSPRKIVTREEVAANSWLDSKMEISYRNKNPTATLPSDPHDRKETEMKSSIFSDRAAATAAQTEARERGASKEDLCEKERELRANVERASPFGRKQLDLSSPDVEAEVFGKMQHSDVFQVKAPRSAQAVKAQQGSAQLRAKAYQPGTWAQRDAVPASELKRMSLAGSGDIFG